MPESRPDVSSKSGPEARPDTGSEAGLESRSHPGSESSSVPDSESADADARLENLELKLMDMEIVLQQLNDVILQQYLDIEKLRNAHGALQKQLDTARENPVLRSPIDELPPHY